MHGSKKITVSVVAGLVGLLGAMFIFNWFMAGQVTWNFKFNFKGDQLPYTYPYNTTPCRNRNDLISKSKLINLKIGAMREKITHCLTGKYMFHIRKGIKYKPFRIEGVLLKSAINDDRRMQSFRDVYKYHIWGTQQSGYDAIQGSGMGSSVEYAERMMSLLDLAIVSIKIQLGLKKVKLLDVPCGDMVWMQKFLANRNDVIYTGIDIVPELIRSHRKRFRNETDWSFKHLDIAKKQLNKSYDLILCRHLLQHLATKDAMTILKHFSESGSLYLITTSWMDTFENKELPGTSGGRFRRLNLDLRPFYLSPPICLAGDWHPLVPETCGHLYAGLWQLPLTQIIHRGEAIKKFNFPEYGISGYSVLYKKN